LAIVAAAAAGMTAAAASARASAASKSSTRWTRAAGANTARIASVVNCGSITSGSRTVSSRPALRKTEG
jgi:hypothetical protein